MFGLVWFGLVWFGPGLEGDTDIWTAQRMNVEPNSTLEKLGLGYHGAIEENLGKWRKIEVN